MDIIKKNIRVIFKESGGKIDCFISDVHTNGLLFFINEMADKDSALAQLKKILMYNLNMLKEIRDTITQKINTYDGYLDDLWDIDLEEEK